MKCSMMSAISVTSMAKTPPLLHSLGFKCTLLFLPHFYLSVYSVKWHHDVALFHTGTTVHMSRIVQPVLVSSAVTVAPPPPHNNTTNENKFQPKKWQTAGTTHTDKQLMSDLGHK